MTSGHGQLGPLWKCELRPTLDWVQLEITLPSPSQPRHLRQRLPSNWGNVYVHPVEGEHSSRQFILRVQNPAGANAVLGELQTIGAPGQRPLTEDDVRVVGIEIALDAYPSGGDRELALDAAVHMIRHLAVPPNGELVITSPEHYTAEPRARILRAALCEGWSVNIAPGGRTHESKLGLASQVDALRCYLKDYDSTPENPYQPLPLHLHRARLERTLLGTAAPFTTLTEWRDFRFETLATMFAMCRSDPTASEFMKVLRSAGTPLGRPDDGKRRDSHRRLRRPGTLRDTALNDRIRVALRKLTRAQRRGSSDE